jgi:hypothetical protein
MNLPSKERTFDFSYQGTVKKYEGTFTVLAHLNVGQKHALALEKTRLLGNYSNPTDDLAGFAIVLANLRIKIIDGPEWWKQSQGGLTIEDEDALVALYREVQKAEEEWIKELKKKAETPQETT